MRVKCYEPDDVGAQRGKDEGHLRDVEKCEKQKRIRQEATSNDKLRVPANIQERVRTSTSCLRLPNSQQLLWVSSGQPMPLESGHEETCDRSEE